MLPARLRTVATVIAAGAAVVTTISGSQSSQVNRPWPPGLQTVPADAPVLTPAEAVKSFYMPPGYRVELVAAEPLVQDPIVMDWDPEGRLWVVEMPGFVRDLKTPEPNLDPIGRIVVLEDRDRNGAMDKRTVFADRLVLARSVKVLERGVLVAEPPNVWLMKDTNGDLEADVKELVTDQYGRREARVEQNANEFYWALDNRMHTAESDVFLQFKNGGFELQKTLARGEWGVTQDDAGRIYRNTNESALHVDFVPTPYFLRNPSLLRTRGSYEALRDEANAVNLVWPVRPNPGTNRAYQTGIDRPDGSLNRFTAVCAPLVYRGDRLPTDAHGNVFVAEPAANLVSRLILEDDGRTLRARKAYERGEFLASTDERFRPVYLSNAPDGTLYIADMYRGVIQQRADITEYLRDYIVSHKLEQPIGLGRIYRVVHETTKRDTASASARLTTAQLVERLSHPNGWWRDAAQRMLVERGDKSAAPALGKLAGSAPDWRVRLHALWTLDGIDAIDSRLVLRALDDGSREVRASAIRLAERWIEDAASGIPAALAKKLDDNDWAVRHQLAATIGGLPPPLGNAAVTALLERHGDDPIVLDATLSGLRNREMAILERLLERTEATPQRDAAVVMLSATLTRAGQEAAVQSLFGLINEDARPAWQRAALLRGAEVALLGAAMPGTPARRGGPAMPNAPCPTCPGGRAGPGGAYAFRDPAAAPAPAGRGGGGRTLKLGSAPTALTALAAGGGDLGTRATAVLARVEWPGKAGAAAAAVPLSPDEQKRFDAGREVYRNVCQACHQPDGRGMEKLAPTLVDSPLALAPAEIPIRILLHGKEGPTGLMPPVGQVFSDDQIAAVLTYVRREWGQSGSPVEPAAVATVRKSTTDRTRPWTNAELAALMPKGQ
jgi:mono/diheme cytochrome c family protein/glucose/arabinose dehydrogenase/HEAT repeat protein